MESRVGWWSCALLVAACKTSAPAPSLVLGTVPEPRAESPTWRTEQAWTRWEGVALDEAGRVAVVGHRLVPAEQRQDAPHAVGIVSVFEPEGATAWTATIDGAWVEGVAIEATYDGGVVALLRSVAGDDTDAESVVVAWDVEGRERWRTRTGECRRERPQDLTIDGSGRVAIVAGCDAPDDEVSPEAIHRLTVLDPDGTVAWTTDLAPYWDSGDPTSVAFGEDSRVHVGGWSGDGGGWVVDVDAGKQPPEMGEVHELRMETVQAVLALPHGRVAVVGEPDYQWADDPQYVLVLDSAGERVWAGGYAELDAPVTARATPSGTVRVLDEERVVRFDPSPSSAPTIDPLPVKEGERVVDVAFGLGGAVAFVGVRDGGQWGRTDAWITRIDTRVDPWPAASLPLDAESPVRWTYDPAHDAAAAKAVVRWIDPRGPEPELELPTEPELRRAVALGMLAGAPKCRLALSDSGPDYISYDPAEARVHARLDDPCLRHVLALETLEELTSADYQAAAPSLEALLVAYANTGSDATVGSFAGETVIDFAFSRGHGPALANAALGRAEPDVQRYATERLVELETPEADAMLRLATETAPCDAGMLAAAELVRRDPSFDLSARSPDATAEQLTRRLCLLRHHPDEAVYAAYWAKLLDASGTYRAESVCSGDWSEEEDDEAGECGELDDMGREPPGESCWTEELPDCGELECTIGERHLEENVPHGWSCTLEFERGRDGELYVAGVSYHDWYGLQYGY